jgi:hypothetical protein
MVCRVANPVHRRIAQVDVAARHVDLRAQDMGAIRMLAVAHLAQQPQVLVAGRSR